MNRECEHGNALSQAVNQRFLAVNPAKGPQPVKYEELPVNKETVPGNQ
ncbi:hypothetical protein [Alteribacter aurantiacus]|nr:hypothetical protein [Alteribacter aurantiacus]